MPEDEVRKAYDDHLDAVESVHTELEAALHDLAKRYPRLPIYVEELTADGVNAYKAKAVALLDVSGDAITQARA